MANRPLSPGSHLLLYRRDATPVKVEPEPAPSTKPELPKNCVRIYPAIGGYLLVAYDDAGVAVREARTSPDTWEEAFDELERFRQRASGTHIKVIG